jgi:hypothetical protein
MNAPIKDGGAAFPVMYVSEGMTLRDYFAGQVLSQLAHDFCECDPLHYKVVVFRSYELADLMIAERNNQPNETK